MLKFRILGLTQQRELIEKIVSADNAEQAHQLGLKFDLDIVDIQPISSKFHSFGFKPKFDLAIFAYEVLTLLNAGLSLIETLETLKERLKEGQTNFFMLATLIRQMREGQSFSSALKSFPDVFPPLFIASISASEYTGNMVDALQRYLRYHEQMNVIKQKIISASIYPILLLSVGFAVALFLLCFLVPRFSHIYDGIDSELPWASKILMKWGGFASNNLSFIIFTIICFIVLLIFVLKNSHFSKKISDWIQQNQLLGKQYQLLQFARFYRSLGLLMSGGIPIIKALQMTQNLLSQSFSFKVDQVILDVKHGKGLTESLANSQLTTSVALRLLGAGERNGQLADMLEQVSSFHDKEVSAWVDKFTRLFEPLLMLVIGLIIGGIVVLLYLPIFELAGSIS